MFKSYTPRYCFFYNLDLIFLIAISFVVFAMQGHIHNIACPAVLTTFIARSQNAWGEKTAEHRVPAMKYYEQIEGLFLPKNLRKGNENSLDKNKIWSSETEPVLLFRKRLLDLNGLNEYCGIVRMRYYVSQLYCVSHLFIFKMCCIVYVFIYFILRSSTISNKCLDDYKSVFCWCDAWIEFAGCPSLRFF